MSDAMIHRAASCLFLLPVMAGLLGCTPQDPSEASEPVKGPALAAPMPLPPPPGAGPAPAAPGYAPVPPGYVPAVPSYPPGPPGTALPPPGVGMAEGPKPDAPRQGGGARPIGSGTAFAVAQRGLAVTNAHVVAGCSAVVDDQGRALRVIATDRRHDLALLEAGRSFPSIVRFRGQGGASLGETALVFGYPYGQALGTGINLTNGIVTGTSGIGGDPSRFQMNAAVQPGNSGGPVVDDSGLLLGVAVGRLNDLAVLRATGALPQGINFAVRAEAVEQFLTAQGVQPQRGDGIGIFGGAQAISARITPAVFQVVCRG